MKYIVFQSIIVQANSLIHMITYSFDNVIWV